MKVLAFKWFQLSPISIRTTASAPVGRPRNWTIWLLARSNNSVVRPDLLDVLFLELA